MKIAQRRILSIFSAILVGVVSSGIFALTPQSALASSECSVIPEPNIGYEIPINPVYSSSCENINLGDFAWDTFVALNWPADEGNPLTDTMIGNAPNKPRVWEGYKVPEEVFQFPEEVVQEKKQSLRLSEFGLKFGLSIEESNLDFISRNSDMDTKIELEGLDPLVDRAGNYILNEVRMNPVEVKQIVSKGWNTVEGLQPFATKSRPFELMCSARKPRGTYPQEGDVASVYDNNIPCSVDDGNDSVGTIEIKAAWMVLPEESAKLPPWVDPSEYYTSKRSLYVQVPGEERATTKVTVPVALVGFHVLHKTSQLGWIWATFEHLNNAPYYKDVPKTKHYNLYDPDCKGDCEVNTPMVTKPYLWRLEFPHAVTKGGDPQTPSQITRLVPIRDYAETMNEKWQAKLPSIWKNYQLIGVQWLGNPYNPYNPSQRLRNVLPGKLANPTLEPYVQKTKLGSSCIACHTWAKLPIMAYPPIKADFSFLLKDAKRSSD